LNRVNGDKNCESAKNDTFSIVLKIRIKFFFSYITWWYFIMDFCAKIANSYASANILCFRFFFSHVDFIRKSVRRYENEKYTLMGARTARKHHVYRLLKHCSLFPSLFLRVLPLWMFPSKLWLSSAEFLKKRVTERRNHVIFITYKLNHRETSYERWRFASVDESLLLLLFSRRN